MFMTRESSRIGIRSVGFFLKSFRCALFNIKVSYRISPFPLYSPLLVSKCRDFCAKVFGNQQGGITKKGMGGYYNSILCYLQGLWFSFFKFCVSLKKENGWLKGLRKKRIAERVENEPNTLIIKLSKLLNSPIITDAYKQHIKDVIKDIQEGSPLDLYLKDWKV